MNVVVGVIVDNTMEAAREKNELVSKTLLIQRVESLDKVREAYFYFDTSNSGEIDVTELPRASATQIYGRNRRTSPRAPSR